MGGVNNATHEIKQTDFDPDCDVKNEPLRLFLARQIAPDINFEYAETIIDGKRVIVC